MSCPLYPLQWVRRAFVGASLAWAILLPLAPFAASWPHPSAWLGSFAVAMYSTGAMLCHQLPERSFHLWSKQLPVCARCTGIYAGAAISAVMVSFRREGRICRREAPANLNGRVVLFVSALPTVATLVFEWTTGVTPANWIRGLAGLPLGAAVAWIVIRVN